MRKIIGRRVFDTNTAEHVYDIRCTAYGGDFRWHETGLFRTASGQWFLAGRGNAFSMWGRDGVGGQVPGEGIKLISNDEALVILEAEDMDDVIEEHFEVVEG